MADTEDKAQRCGQGLKIRNLSKQSPQQHQKLLKPVPILPHQHPQKQLQQNIQQVPHQQPDTDHAKLHKLSKIHPVIRQEAPHQQLQNQPQKPSQNHLQQQSQNRQPQQPDQLKNEKVSTTPRVLPQSPRNLQPQSQQKPEEEQQTQQQDQKKEKDLGDNLSYVKSVGSRKDLVGLIVGGRYRIRSCIGNGSFGELYRAINLRNGNEVAVKLERSTAKYQMLMNEARIYQVLQGGVGFPRMHHRGTEGEHNVLVLDLLGPSLEELLNFCSRSFSTKTILLLADQILDRVEFLHINCIIHRDIKPDNFLMGLGRHRTEVFLIDFGLAKKYYSTRRHQHIAYSEDNDLVGTARYSSIHSHYAEQSRRDDLEAVGYMFLYLQRGHLPWQGIRAQTQAQKHERIAESKVSVPLNVLCSGVPIEFYLYLHYCRGLRFQEEPNYGYLRHLFKSLYRLNFLHYDFVYDWMRPLRERKRLELTFKKREKKANKWYHHWDRPLITFKYPKVIRPVIRYRAKEREQKERDVDRDRERSHGRSIDGDRSEERNKGIIIHRYKRRDNDVDRNNHKENDKEREKDRYKNPNKNLENDKDGLRFRYRSRDKEPVIHEDRNRCKCKCRERNRSGDKDEYRETARYTNREKCRDRNVSRERDNERGGDRSQVKERVRDLDNARNTDSMRYSERHREMDRTADRDREKCRNCERYPSKEIERYRKVSREKDRDREEEKDKYRDRQRFKHRLRDRDRVRVRNLHREENSIVRTKDRRAFSYDSTRYPKPLGNHQVMMQTERR